MLALAHRQGHGPGQHEQGDQDHVDAGAAADRLQVGVVAGRGQVLGLSARRPRSPPCTWPGRTHDREHGGDAGRQRRRRCPRSAGDADEVGLARVTVERGGLRRERRTPRWPTPRRPGRPRRRRPRAERGQVLAGQPDPAAKPQAGRPGQARPDHDLARGCWRDPRRQPERRQRRARPAVPGEAPPCCGSRGAGDRAPGDHPAVAQVERDREGHVGDGPGHPGDRGERRARAAGTRR